MENAGGALNSSEEKWGKQWRIYSASEKLLDGEATILISLWLALFHVDKEKK